MVSESRSNNLLVNVYIPQYVTTVRRARSKNIGVGTVGVTVSGQNGTSRRRAREVDKSYSLQSHSQRGESRASSLGCAAVLCRGPCAVAVRSAALFLPLVSPLSILSKVRSVFLDASILPAYTQHGPSQYVLVRADSTRLRTGRR
jgi:hypothetical protein